MSWGDVAGGVDQAIQGQLLRRTQQMWQQRQWDQSQRAYNDAQTQRGFENQQQIEGGKRAQQSLDALLGINAAEKSAQTAHLQNEDELARTKSKLDVAESVAPGEQIDSNDPRYKAAGGFIRTGRVMQPGGMGSDFQGPMPDGRLPQDVANDSPRIITAAPTAKQQEKITADAEKAAEVKRSQDALAEIVRHNKAEESKPPSEGGNQLVPEIDPKTGQQTGRFFSFNSKTNSWGSPTGTGPAATKPNPGAAQEAQVTQGKKDALASLDQIDQAIDAAKDKIGPGMGRVSSIQQMVGNPDPTISALGTKMLLGKMQVDHAAAGSVRAGSSPAILQRWDNILGNNQTPESMKAAVQAMREILGGSATPAAGSSFRVVGVR